MSSHVTQHPRPETLHDEKSFTLYTARDFPSLPEMDWLVEDIFPEGGFLSVYGPSGVGKSFLCLDLAAAVAEGRDWFGYQTKRKQVVIIALEGQSGLRRRVEAWQRHHGELFPIGVDFVFDEFHINDQTKSCKLGAAIQEEDGAGLIIIDTLNRASPGTDENSSADMGEILAGAAILNKFTGAAVLLVHHPGKDVTRRLRGHSSLFAALDTVVELNQDGNVIRWTVIKSKDGENGLSHTFVLETVDAGVSKSGKPVTSCVVREVGGHTPQRNAKSPRGANQRAILDATIELLVNQRIQSYLETPDWPDGFPPGLPATDVQEKIKDVLEEIGSKHRFLRTQEAFKRLCEMGFLIHFEEFISLPSTSENKGNA